MNRRDNGDSLEGGMMMKKSLIGGPIIPVVMAGLALRIETTALAAMRSLLLRL